MNLKLIIKGFIVGVGKIIPGVSGAMLAMFMGIYEDLMEAVTHFFDDKKKYFAGLVRKTSKYDFTLKHMSVII